MKINDYNIAKVTQLQPNGCPCGVWKTPGNSKGGAPEEVWGWEDGARGAGREARGARGVETGTGRDFFHSKMYSHSDTHSLYTQTIMRPPGTWVTVQGSHVGSVDGCVFPFLSLLGSTIQ